MEFVKKLCYNGLVVKNTKEKGMMMNKKIKSTLILLTAAVIWGFAFAAQCVVDNNVIGNFTFNGVRYLLGAVVLVPVIMVFEKGSTDFKKLALSSLVAGTFLFIASALQQYGISLSHNAGRAGFLTGLYTVLVPIFSFIIWRKRTGVNTWIAAVLAAVGLYFLSAGEDFSGMDKGDLVVFTGAFFWAGHILSVDKAVKDIPPVKFSAMQFLVCGMWHMLMAVMTETITMDGILATTMPILYTGIMSTGVAYTCQVIGQRDADPNFAAIILSTECVFSAVGGAIFLNEVMSLRGYFGCVLIFAGILVSQMKKKGEKLNATQ